MGLPASKIRQLLAQAARTYLSEGVKVKKGSYLAKPLQQALMRQAYLSPTTERGMNQLTRLRALLEGQLRNKKAPDISLGAQVPYRANEASDIYALNALLHNLTKTETGADEAWRKMMGS